MTVFDEVSSLLMDGRCKKKHNQDECATEYMTVFDEVSSLLIDGGCYKRVCKVFVTGLSLDVPLVTQFRITIC